LTNPSTSDTNRSPKRLRDNMIVRCEVIRTIRAFWEERGFLEVDTPQLVRAPGSESTIEPFCSSSASGKQFYLVTSPEHHMKRLLGRGFEQIFQINHCFRDEDASATSHPEFSMLEWYRVGKSYVDIMSDVEQLIAHVARTVRGSTTVAYQGREVDLTPPWHRITVAQAFAQLAGIDLENCGQQAEFLTAAHKIGVLSAGHIDSWDEIFFKVFLERVEPALSEMGPVFIVDYPARMAALAQLKPGAPDVAERVEAYIGGLELGNGFTELNDPVEQEERFLAEREKRLAAGNPIYPMDCEFLEMLRQGMPPAGGFALGVDRLCMLLADAGDIDEVVAFPFPKAPS
jgi:EF-P lysine aminoacylase GenX